MDDLDKIGVAQRTKINLDDPSEVDYWTKELGVSTGELRNLIARVGTYAEAVREELGMLGKAR
jgi:Protein of unknown function (DUF3606)